MRDLSKNEKSVIREIIANNNYDSPLTLGDILIKLYKISWIEKNSKPDVFYENTVVMCLERESEPFVYEAISLFYFLKENRYIVSKELIKQDIIGEKWGIVEMSDEGAKQLETRIFNFYEHNLWNLLDSQFIATNSLFDFAKDFKTPSQRLNENNLFWCKIGILAAILIGFKDCIKDLACYCWTFFSNLLYQC